MASSTSPAAGTRAGESNYRWAIEVLLFLAQLTVGINILGPAPLFPLIMNDYGLERGMVSLLVAVVALMLAAGNVMSGFLAAKFGISRTFGASLFLMSVGVLTPLAPNFNWLLVLRLLFGFGAGVGVPIVGAIVSQWFQPKELPVVNGLNWTGQTVGLAVSMFVGVPLANAMNWAAPLLMYGAVGVFVAVAWAFWGKTPQVGGPAMEAPKVRELVGVLREKATVLLTLGLVGPMVLYVSLSSWLPTYYHEVFGFSLTKASFVAAFLPLTGILATAASGFLSAKVGLRRPFLIYGGLVYVLAAFGTFLVDNTFVVYAAVIVLGFAHWLVFPIALTIPMEMPGSSPEKVATVVGAMLTVGNTLTVAAPILVGATTDVLGSYLPSLVVLSACTLSLMVSGLLLPETGPKALMHAGARGRRGA